MHVNIFYRHSPILDKFAVSTSAICALHCLCLPIILSVFPTLGATIFGQEAFHVLLLWLIIPLSFFTLSMGCRKHRSWLVAGLGLAGSTLLIATVFLGHDLLGGVGERALTLTGATAIAVGHVRNYLLCRRANCDS